MKKNIKIIFIFIFAILLVSCGFKKMKKGDNYPIYINKINIIGDKKISYTLKNEILLISNKDSKKKYEIVIQIENKKTNKIKDITGKVTRYNLSITANIILKNLNNYENINKSINRSADFDVDKNHSNTIVNEKKATENIIQQLSDDIINFIILLTKN